VHHTQVDGELVPMNGEHCRHYLGTGVRFVGEGAANVVVDWIDPSGRSLGMWPTPSLLFRIPY
jgi:hypothetical protein